MKDVSETSISKFDFGLLRAVRLCVIALLASVLVVSAAASAVQFLFKHLAQLGALGYGGVVAYTVTLTVMIVFCARPRCEADERRLAWRILGGTFALKLTLVAAWSSLPQLGDHLYLLQFVDRWVSGGDEALRQLSREIHDYPVWSGRAWPLLYPLRVMFPTRFVLVTQLGNCILSTAILAAIYGLTRRMTSRPLLPLALAALSPSFFWNVLGYASSSRFLGTLFILAVFAILRRMLDGGQRPRTSEILMSISLGLVMFVLHLQQGLDLVIITLLAFTLFYALCRGRFQRPVMRVVLSAFFLPLAVTLPLARSADNWFAVRNDGKLSAGFIVHMAYGWNLVTWGEFYWPVVDLDIRTPPERKNSVMLGYIRQQIREHPFDALVRLPVVKAIKLFQLGAGSGTKEKFEKGGYSGWAEVSEASRFVFAPVILLLAAIGCRRFLRVGEPDRMMWLLLVLDFTMAYTFFSEVTPGYSFFFQFVLITVAATGLDVLHDSPRVTSLLNRQAVSGTTGPRTNGH